MSPLLSTTANMNSLSLSPSSSAQHLSPNPTPPLQRRNTQCRKPLTAPRVSPKAQASMTSTAFPRLARPTAHCLLQTTPLLSSPRPSSPSSPSPFPSHSHSHSHSRTLPPPGASAKSLIPQHGYDYYELLGLESDASPAEIKSAYRRLQKRCHPDVAGREDMAVLLNEAYSALIDPITRFTYDQLRVTWLSDDSFTGKPVYSTWHGPEEEESALFVDEVSCIGCLNCAVIANKTFVIETKHGKARAVHQWADDINTLNAAVLSCPVSCIKWVERRKLAALEHVMSTMARPSLYTLMVGGDGGRSPDVFHETDKFLHKRKRSEEEVQEARRAREDSRGAFDAIRSWFGAANGVMNGDGSRDRGPVALMVSPTHSSDALRRAKEAREARESRGAVGADGTFVPEDLKALHDAAYASNGSRREETRGFFNVRVGDEEEEYWNPTKQFAFASRASKPKTYAAPSGAPKAASAGVSGSGFSATDAAEAANGYGPAAASSAHASYAGHAHSSGEAAFAHATSAATSAGREGVTQVISVEEFMGFRAQERQQRAEEAHHILSVLPILVALAAGSWAWLDPTSGSLQAQAGVGASLGYAGVPLGQALIPAEIVASNGLRVGLCMAVWYAVGAVVSQTLRLGLSFFLPLLQGKGNGEGEGEEE